MQVVYSGIKRSSITIPSYSLREARDLEVEIWRTFKRPPYF